ncbi:hypothetical protein J6590_071895 [Homalodisca vitripennis]|nr:hypothetical protein J6590_071895 [Homalodisca vitripennis]
MLQLLEPRPPGPPGAPGICSCNISQMLNTYSDILEPYLRYAMLGSRAETDLSGLKPRIDQPQKNKKALSGEVRELCRKQQDSPYTSIKVVGVSLSQGEINYNLLKNWQKFSE